MIKKYISFLIGLFIMALGLALSVKADLGISPISCIPYIYSLKYEVTFVDLAMYIVLAVKTSSYFFQIISCFLSCIVLAFGLLILIKTRISYLLGEGLIMAIVDRYKKPFEPIKIVVDIELVCIGIGSFYLLLNTLQKIQEDTIIAAIIVGYHIKQYQKGFLTIN